MKKLSAFEKLHSRYHLFVKIVAPLSDVQKMRLSLTSHTMFDLCHSEQIWENWNEFSDDINPTFVNHNRIPSFVKLALPKKFKAYLTPRRNLIKPHIVLTYLSNLEHLELYTTLYDEVLSAIDRFRFPKLKTLIIKVSRSTSHAYSNVTVGSFLFRLFKSLEHSECTACITLDLSHCYEYIANMYMKHQHISKISCTGIFIHNLVMQPIVLSHFHEALRLNVYHVLKNLHEITVRPINNSSVLRELVLVNHLPCLKTLRLEQCYVFDERFVAPNEKVNVPELHLQCIYPKIPFPGMNIREQQRHWVAYIFSSTKLRKIRLFNVAPVIICVCLDLDRFESVEVNSETLTDQMLTDLRASST